MSAVQLSNTHHFRISGDFASSGLNGCNTFSIGRMVTIAVAKRTQDCIDACILDVLRSKCAKFVSQVSVGDGIWSFSAQDSFYIVCVGSIGEEATSLLERFLLWR